MSDTESLLADAPLGALVAAGWRPQELEWERLQERALARAAAGETEAAARDWAAALRLARESFAGDDPRLALSLANHAAVLRRAGDAALAASLFEEALGVWDASESWVAGLAPERRARSSTYHLRLQRQYRSGYDHFSEGRYAALAEEGRADLMALEAGQAGDPAARLDRWRKQRPEGFTDGRKLLAAVLLLGG